MPHFTLFVKIVFVFLVLNISLKLNAQSWSQLNDSPFYTEHSNGFGHAGKGYIFQGGGSTNLWEYSPETDNWNQISNFPGSARGLAIGDDWDGKYYYGFGVGNQFMNDLWVFNPEDMTFTELPSCPCTGRSHPAFIAENGKVFMGSGSSANGDLDDWWEYDIESQQWTEKPTMPGGVRHHPFQFSIGDKVYVGGGHQANWLEYDPTESSWKEIDNTPEGRVAGTQFSYNDLGFVLAGDDRTHTHVPPSQTFMTYNAELDEWLLLPPLPNGSKWAPSSFIIDDILYFFGGFSDNIDEDNSMWQFDLNYVNCLPASRLQAINIDTASVDLFWEKNINSISDTLKWRKVGDQTWNCISNPQVLYSLENLETCQLYEFYVRTVCEDRVSDSDFLEFSTDGCCLNPELSVTNLSPTSATIIWNPITAASEYTLRWKDQTSDLWNEEFLEQTSYNIEGLDECSNYEVQIKSTCAIAEIEFSASFVFNTSGCGACETFDYCTSQGSLSTFGEPIISVRIGEYFNESGNDEGYGEFIIPSTLSFGVDEPFTIEVELQGQSQELAIWIDFNANGLFDQNEEVHRNPFPQAVEKVDIFVPENTSLTTTKMRISYGLDFESLLPCGEDFFGETEDYCITFTNTTSSDISEIQNNFQISPNPFFSEININSNLPTEGEYEITLLDLSGQTLGIFNLGPSKNTLNLSDFRSGLYLLRIKKGREIGYKKLIKM